MHNLRSNLQRECPVCGAMPGRECFNDVPFDITMTHEELTEYAVQQVLVSLRALRDVAPQHIIIRRYEAISGDLDQMELALNYPG